MKDPLCLLNLICATLMAASLGCCPATRGGGQAATPSQAPLERRVSISDLGGIQAPEGITTSCLGRRSADAESEPFPGVQVVTRCKSSHCLDGLVVDGKTVLHAVASNDESEMLATDGGWVERVIRVAWADERVVSIYLAQSSFSGGAHANNSLVCQTYQRDGSKPLQLGTFVPRARESDLLVRAKELFDDATAIQVLGRTLDAAGFELGPTDFRFDRSPGWHGAQPELVLCARGPYPSRSSDLLELRLEAFPVAHLLGAPVSPDFSAASAPVAKTEDCSRSALCQRCGGCLLQDGRCRPKPISYCGQSIEADALEVTCYEGRGLRTELMDLEPLACLEQLQVLRLVSGELEFILTLKIKDLLPLAQLKRLRQLSLGHTDVKSISALAGLDELRELSVHYSPVSDLRPLSGLKKLERLDLSWTAVVDLTSLAHLTQLESLDLTGTQVADLTPLTGLKKLKWLGLLEKSRVPAAQIQILKAALPDLKISVGARY